MKTVIAAAVTPFDEWGRPDLESARRLYEWGLDAGLDGFFLFGSMGEWPLLTDEVRADIAETACGVVGDRARIILGVHSTGLPGILRNIDSRREFSHTHYTALLPAGRIAGPADPVAFVHAIADHCDKPFMLYNCPSANGVVISPEQFRDIFAHPNVAGVKNSAGAMRVRKELQILRDAGDFELFEGDEWSVDEAIAMGHDGVVVGFGSMGARVFRAIVDAAAAGDLDRARHIQFELIEIFRAVYGPDVAWWCKGQKYGLKKMGVLACDACLVAAQRDLPEERRAAVDACVEAHPVWFGRGDGS